MEGNGGEEGWGEDEGEDDEDERREHGTEKPDGHNDGAQVDRGRRANRSREGKWESGKGRCAVTGRRLLGGSEGLRRVMV